MRRASDPTLLLGYAGPLTAASAAAAVVGGLLAVAGPTATMPLAFTLSSVVAIGLFGAARRVDTAARPDFRPDRSARSRRVAAAILTLAVVGTAVSSWSLALDFAR